MLSGDNHATEQCEGKMIGIQIMNGETRYENRLRQTE